jgi:hypothetical protein
MYMHTSYFIKRLTTNLQEPQDSPRAHPLLDALGCGLRWQQVKLVDRNRQLERQRILRGSTRPAAAAAIKLG